MSNLGRERLDRFLDLILFRFLPPAVTPDFFTALRLIFIPLVLWLLAMQLFALALAAFLLAVIFDVLDGSLYRIRKKSSGWGIVLDPLADKLLVILVCLFLAFFYPLPIVLMLSVIADLMIIFSGFLMLVFLKGFQLPQADIFGKLKMVLESIGVVSVFCYLLGGDLWLWPSFAIMILAAISGLLSFVAYGIKFVRTK